ncbi:putative threonine dehydratase, ACT-like domain, pyridoxal-phosphate dependent enzyme [Plasmopara halstedii]
MLRHDCVRVVRRGLSSLATKPSWVRPGSHDYLREILESRVYDVAIQTPLQLAPSLTQSLPGNCRLYLKREDMQPTFSFNLRGAYNKIANLTLAQRKRGIVACSAGGHLDGVAYAAAELGVDAVVIAPVGTARNVSQYTKSKITMVEHGADFDASMSEAIRMAQTEGRSLVHPFDDPLVIAGNGTVAMEILKETAGDRPAAIFAPVGGGGLIAGLAAYIKEVAPGVKLIGVEAEGANLLESSLKAGSPVTLPSVNRFTEEVGIRTVGLENFRLCKDVVDEVITVSTDEICIAIKDVFGDTRSLVEPTGAISVAGAKKYAHKKNAQSEKYVAVLAAANLDFDRLRFISERSDDRERFMAVKIPEKIGSFQDLYNVIFPFNVTEFTYRMDSESDNEARICLSIQTKTECEFVGVIKAINARGDMRACDLASNELAKLHLRHLGGGRPENVTNERLFRIEFPERPGALKDFLEALGKSERQWNVSLFHYRNHGADIGRVLVGFQVPKQDNVAFEGFLNQLSFRSVEETNNEAYSNFLV